MTWRLLLMPGAGRNSIKSRTTMPHESRTNSAPWQTSRLACQNPERTPEQSVVLFRVGQYRIILVFEGNVMIITVIDIGNRSNVYRKY